MVLRCGYCKECGENIEYKWCGSCQPNNFTNCTSGNEKIDNSIQKMAKALEKYDMTFEWIPYNQFYDIDEISETGFTAAVWKDGPLYYSYYEKEWIRISDLKVGLVFSRNSQDTIDELLNKV